MLYNCRWGLEQLITDFVTIGWTYSIIKLIILTITRILYRWPLILGEGTIIKLHKRR